MLDQLRYENTLRYIQQKWGRSPNASQMKDLLSQVYGQQLSSEQIQQIVGEVYQGQADVTHQDALQSIPERIQQLILNQNKKG
jgi:hypothetical protein